MRNRPSVSRVFESNLTVLSLSEVTVWATDPLLRHLIDWPTWIVTSLGL